MDYRTEDPATTALMTRRSSSIINHGGEKPACVSVKSWEMQEQQVQAIVILVL